MKLSVVDTGIAKMRTVGIDEISGGLGMPVTMC